VLDDLGVVYHRLRLFCYPNLEEDLNAPLIGLTTTRNLNNAGKAQFSLGIDYSNSVLRAGGIPVLIPLGQPEEQLDQLITYLDGVIFTGGGDILPDHYHGSQHPLVSYVDEDRDRVELLLFKQILPRKIPFFGICRGFQVINVALGGTLYEDILDQKPGSLRHQYHPDYARDFLAHSVQIEADSRLVKIIGETEVEVNSFHHQGIRQLASELQATAYAPDGIIEGIEMIDYPYGLAVQWHPENLYAYPKMPALFEAFVEAARKYQQTS